MTYFLSDVSIFKGLSTEEINSALKTIKHYEKNYSKGQVILKTGDITGYIGIVVGGSVQIESIDLFGNRSILGLIQNGDIFAESYACIPNQPLLVDVVARENTKVLFLSASSITSSQSELITKISGNLLQITARKNLKLSMRIFHASPKKIRDRLYSFFSEQVSISGSTHIKIQMDRQQLADYLGVERTALSKELGKMKKEGLIEYYKNEFEILL